MKVLGRHKLKAEQERQRQELSEDGSAVEAWNKVSVVKEELDTVDWLCSRMHVYKKRILEQAKMTAAKWNSVLEYAAHLASLR